MAEPVLIIGGGPVGMTLASELTRFGVAARVVDKSAHRTDKSKAMVLWSRTLELLDRGEPEGASAFVSAGFKVDGVQFMSGQKHVGRVTMDGVESAFNYALTIPQSETERLLEERLARQGIAVERNTEATGFNFDPDGADVTLQHHDGRLEQVRTSWLIGCDGAHSAVRHALNLPFSGETLMSDWFLADVHLSGYPHPATDAAIYWHKDGVLIFFPISPDRFRIIGDLPSNGAAAPDTPTLAAVQAIVDRRGPSGTTSSDPIWLSGFRINGRKVAAYRHGRVFVAGDAAHVHSPAGGQGMNTGMQDAVNLAWKLALVVRGEARDTLLDSFSPERSAVGDEVLKAAGRLTTIGTLKNPVAQTVRNVAAHVMLGLPTVTHALADTLSEIVVHYDKSPLNGPCTADHLRSGARVRPLEGSAPFGAGTRPRFTLCAENASETVALASRYPDLVDQAVRAPLSPDTLALVRPDGYLGCATGDPDEIVAYLDRWAASSGAQTATASF